MRAMVSGSIPVRRPPMSASPESLRRTRLYRGGIGDALYNKKGGPPAALNECSVSCLFQKRGDLGSEVVAALFLDPFAQLVAGETGHRVGAAGLLARRGQVLVHSLLVVADIRLLQKAGFAVELVHLADDHLLD